MMKYLESIDPFDRNSANLFVRVEHLARYHYASEFIRKRKLKRVLDCACGSGYGSMAMAAHVQSVDAADGNNALLEQGKEACKSVGIQNVCFHQAELNGGLPFLDSNSYDCITCFETLEHIEQEERLLLEFARVLRKGRWLLLSVPKEGYEPVDVDGRPENPWHLRLYSMQGLHALVERCGFVVEQSLGQPYTNMMRAQTESWRRDTGTPQCRIDDWFVETSESLRFFSRLWGWPEAEQAEKSNVCFLICRRR